MGTARAFDGANTKVEATIAAMDSGDWTIAIWVKATSAGEGSAGRALGIATGGGTVCQIIRTNSAARTLLCRQVGSTNADATSTAALTASLWSCIVGTFRASDGKCRLYLGTETTPMAEMAYASQTTLVTRTTGGTAATIGNAPNQANTWDGALASPVIEAREWSLAEMDQYRRTGRPPSFGSALRAWWPLEGTRADEPDRAGLTAAGVVTAAPTPPFVAGPSLWLPHTAKVPRMVRR